MLAVVKNYCSTSVISNVSTAVVATSGTRWGVTVTASATVNTMGSWIEVFPPQTQDIYQIVLVANTGYTTNTLNNTLMDLGIGTSTAAVTVIADSITVSMAAQMLNPVGGGFPVLGKQYILPIRIPAGQSLYARTQSSIASRLIGVVILATIGSPGYTPYCQKIVSIGAVLSTSNGTAYTPSNSTTVEGAWFQISPSTAENYIGVLVSQTHTAATGLNGFKLDVGVGAAGSEICIAQDLAWTTEFSNRTSQGIYYPGYAKIPAGSRISVRGRYYTTPPAGLGAIVYGMLG
jgi:hypothetical protein